MTKKKSAEIEPKFTVKKREKKVLPAFENLTPFRHPLADVFEFPSPASEVEINKSEPTDSIDSESRGSSPTSSADSISSRSTTFINPSVTENDFNTTNSIDVQMGRGQKYGELRINPASGTSGTSLSSKTSDNHPQAFEKNNYQYLLKGPVSPVRDFQKVANSITRDAIPEGLFKPGKCKELYDTLYHLTRGSIKPCRSVRISKPRLQKLAGIGTKITLVSNLRHLESVGLIVINTLIGEHGGNEYTVYLPEEIEAERGSTPTSESIPTSEPTPTSPPNPSQSDYSLQDIDPLVGAETSETMPSLNSIKTESGQLSKTLLKTNKGFFDDERYSAAFSDFVVVLEETIKKHTGKGINSVDKAKWKHVAEVLAAQIELIASRTTISNAPAVLAEHLQRHLNNKRVLERLGLITPAEAREMKEPETIKKETPFLFLCPDCKGTSMWNKDGKGMRPGCPHKRLEEAVSRAKENGEI